MNSRALNSWLLAGLVLGGFAATFALKTRHREELPAAPRTAVASPGPGQFPAVPLQARTAQQPEQVVQAGPASAAALPIQMRFMRVAGGRSRAGEILSAADQALRVDVEISNAESGKRELRMIYPQPRSSTQVGQSDGWNLEPGDLVKLHADGYADHVQRVP